ncbi:MAG: diphosphomevalonate decarboxylase, partial [Patescibacteria group bacterium]|nr:diphosphomevalonate decarboxylase [Patescibacteria group bacterium]
TLAFKEILENNVGRKTARPREFVTKSKEYKRVVKQLDMIRKLANISLKAKVVTQNNFPSSSGIASSASGFAALTLAASKAAGLKLSEKTLSILARVGSGSACRSIPDGFVEWEEGDSNETSYAHSLYPANYWDLRDLILIVEKSRKKVGSTVGMGGAWSSPLMDKRLKTQDVRLKKIKDALKTKNFPLLGEAMEEECLNMHQVMQTQNPPLFYWTKDTEKIMASVKQWRSEGLPVYFTVDAGPNVHIFCEGVHEREVVDKFKSLISSSGLKSLPRTDVRGLIVNKPTVGARIIEKDLTSDK